jgi:hypothetical protein
MKVNLEQNAAEVEHVYNDIGLYDTSPIALGIVWYQL